MPGPRPRTPAWDARCLKHRRARRLFLTGAAHRWLERAFFPGLRGNEETSTRVSLPFIPPPSASSAHSAVTHLHHSLALLFHSSSPVQSVSVCGGGVVVGSPRAFALSSPSSMFVPAPDCEPSLSSSLSRRYACEMLLGLCVFLDPRESCGGRVEGTPPSASRYLVLFLFTNLS